MHDLAFAPQLADFEVYPLSITADRVELRVIAAQPRAACPVCHEFSSRVHSRYERCVADLPWNRARVLLRVQARRFRCLVPGCTRRIFCERLPALVAVYARRTAGLTALLQAVGRALGGRPGGRLLDRFCPGTSRTTLWRLVRRVRDPAPARDVQVRSVDEWAYRRGRQYGMILVDLERHRAIDLLPAASAATLARWLREHPGVQVLSRDRSGPFAEGGRQGAPQAVQGADRFHLLRNCGRITERMARRHATLIGRLPSPRRAGLPTPLLRPDRQGSRDRTHQALQARVMAIQALKERGATMASTARALQMNRKTVHKYWAITEAPERRYTGRPSSALTPYEGYWQERWRQGERNARDLWRTIMRRGYPGQYQNVARYLAALKQLGHSEHPASVPAAGLTLPYTVALALRRPAQRTAEEQRALEDSKALHPELHQALSLLGQFATLLRQSPGPRPAERLDAGEVQARALGAPEMSAFITKLEQDRSAVEAALSLPYSQGQTEGQITRLKALKRAMFGRANFDLLGKRFLAT